MPRKKLNNISLEEFISWSSDTEITYDYSKRENKRITVDLVGLIKVTLAGKILYKGWDKELAVKYYNAITTTYKDPFKHLKLDL